MARRPGVFVRGGDPHLARTQDAHRYQQLDADHRPREQGNQPARLQDRCRRAQGVQGAAGDRRGVAALPPAWLSEVVLAVRNGSWLRRPPIRSE